MNEDLRAPVTEQSQELRSRKWHTKRRVWEIIVCVLQYLMDIWSVLFPPLP